MSLTFTILAVIIIIGFMIWRNRKIAERNRINHISEEKRQGENLKLEEKIRLRAEEGVSKNQEERKLRAEQETNTGKAIEERDSREKELRQKISDRKKHELEEEQRKTEEKK